MPVNSNPKGSGVVTIRATTTETITLSSLLNSGESNGTFSIIGVAWSGTWTVVRNGTTLLSLANTGNWLDLDQKGISITDNPTSDIVLTGSGTILLRVKKNVLGATYY